MVLDKPVHSEGKGLGLHSNAANMMQLILMTQSTGVVLQP